MTTSNNAMKLGKVLATAYEVYNADNTETNKLVVLALLDAYNLVAAQPDSVYQVLKNDDATGVTVRLVADNN